MTFLKTETNPAAWEAGEWLCLPGGQGPFCSFGEHGACVPPSYRLWIACGSEPSSNHGAASSGTNRKGCQCLATSGTQTAQIFKLRATSITVRQKSHKRV